MSDAVQIRKLIAGASLVDGRRASIRMIRQAVRNRIFAYAQKYKIVDFADTVTVEQVHRDWRKNLIDIATARAGEAQAATTTAELLTVYDRISQWIK